MSVLLLLAAAASDPSAPGTQAPATEMTVEQAIREAKPGRKICKTERFVGSHLSQRVCMTKMEWEAGAQNAKDALNRMVLVNPPEKGAN